MTGRPVCGHPQCQSCDCLGRDHVLRAAGVVKQTGQAVEECLQPGCSAFAIDPPRPGELGFVDLLVLDSIEHGMPPVWVPDDDEAGDAA